MGGVTSSPNSSRRGHREYIDPQYPSTDSNSESDNEEFMDAESRCGNVFPSRPNSINGSFATYGRTYSEASTFTEDRSDGSMKVNFDAKEVEVTDGTNDRNHRHGMATRNQTKHLNSSSAVNSTCGTSAQRQLSTSSESTSKSNAGSGIPRQASSVVNIHDEDSGDTETPDNPRNPVTGDSGPGRTFHLPSHIKHTSAPYGMMFQCICGKVFRHRQNVAYHTNCDGSRKIYKCDKCPKEFPGQSYLNAHVQDVHDDPAFTCGVCKKQYRRRTRLDVHVRKHTGERPFECNQCHGSYISAESLRCHIQRHGNAMHECDTCRKFFHSRGELQLHKKTHEKKAYSESLNLTCSSCGSKYRTKKTLAAHVKKFHPTKEILTPSTQTI